MDPPETMLARRAQAVALELLDDFRIVIINGPRQAGKSTLLQVLAAQVGGSMLTLDDRRILRVARTDPGGLIDANPRPLFIDEVQRGGDPLVLAIKAEVDRHPRTPGQFVLAGSSRFLTVPTLSESLAGRAAIIDLWPLSQDELEGTSANLVDLLFDTVHVVRALRPDPCTRRDIMERVVRGGYPEVHRLSSDRARDAWFANYRRQLIERDLTELRRIRQAGDLPRLLRALAARTAQELNLAAVARDAGLSPDVTRDYVSLLDTIYVHRTVAAWATNLTARVKRHPKLYLVDSGLAASLVGASTDRLADPTFAASGALLETFVAAEIGKQLTWSSVRAEQFHFRDRDQREVDIVLEATDGRVVGIEVKAARDVDETDFRWLAYLRDRIGARFVQGVVVHLGSAPLPFGDRLTALPISGLWSGAA